MHFTPRSVPALTVLAAAVLATTAACGGSTGSTNAGGTAAAGTASASASASAAGAAASPSAAASAQDTGAASSSSTGTGAGAGSPSASPGYPVDLEPPTAAPGSQVAVYGLTCTASTGTATSAAFTGKVALSMLSNATGGTTTVKTGLAAGSYPVTVSCGDITVTGTLTVS